MSAAIASWLQQRTVRPILAAVAIFLSGLAIGLLSAGVLVHK